jgi:hypothetical protein
MKRNYELKLSTGKTVIWEGENGEDACKYYAETHPGVTVIAWRDYPRHGVFLVHPNQIVG